MNVRWTAHARQQGLKQVSACPARGRALVLAHALLDELALPAALLAGDALPSADLALVVVRAPAAVEAAVPAPVPRVRSHRLLGFRLKNALPNTPVSHCLVNAAGPGQVTFVK